MQHLLNLLLVPLLAVCAPLLVRLPGPRLRLPVVVVELLLGILVGPALLGWVQPSSFLATLSDVGLVLLFFVAGSEIDPARFAQKTGIRAAGAWVLSLGAALAVGWIIAPGMPAVFIGIALSSTALGTLLPVLRDAGLLRTPFGLAATAIGAAGEFGPLVAISIFLGAARPGPATFVLIAFVAIVLAAVGYARWRPHGGLHRLVNATLHTSAQFAIRAVVLIVASLVVLSTVLGLDMLLGAFAAGILWRLLMRDAAPADREQVESKIEAIAFGVFVPIFFIYTGVVFDVSAFVQQPSLLLLVPGVALLLLLLRGVPSALLVVPGRGTGDRLPLALMAGTALPIIVAVTAIGVDQGVLATSAAAVLVAGGMLTVVLFPLAAMTLRARAQEVPVAGDP